MTEGLWLGVDVGSARKKICSYCLIAAEASGDCEVLFEQGPARPPYPEINTRQKLIGRRRPPYLKDEIDAEIGKILDRSELVSRWIGGSAGRPSAVAVDAPVAFALDGDRRLTEDRSTDTFETPTRAVFEQQLGEKKDTFLRVNNFWKCVGFSVYRHLATRIDPSTENPSLETVAALTCDRTAKTQRLRETFPSDVYKRANGYEGKDGVAGILSAEARGVLETLTEVEWRAAGSEPGHRPASQTLDRLETIRKLLRVDLEAGADRMCEMRKRPGRTGDLWDAFTCAYAACCENHGGAELHGGEGSNERLRSEGAILTVSRRA